MTLRAGFTTGSCAAAAAKAAALCLADQAPREVEIPLPDGTRAVIAVLAARRVSGGAEATVRKDAGDDPDVTHGCEVTSRVAPDVLGAIRFAAGPGVGTVTLPGLAVPPGEPAINPAPRRQIAAALAEAGCWSALVTVSIAGGEELARRTFNGRLGIVNGLSILGTSGRVRAFSHPAIAASVRSSIDVAVGSGLRALVLVPGHHGRRAVQARFALAPQQVIEVADAWGEALDHVARQPLTALLAAGHPSKLVKLAIGQWNTHVSAGAAPVELVREWARELDLAPIETPTIDGVFSALQPDGRVRLAAKLAERVGVALRARLPNTPSSVLLTDMHCGSWGHAGDLTPWEAT